MPRSGPSNVLILAPQGRDATLAASLLDEAGISTTICRDLPDVVTKLNAEASFLVVTEEAVRNEHIKQLAHWIDEQPTWSDLPVVLIVRTAYTAADQPVEVSEMVLDSAAYILEYKFTS